ncbi:MAG: DUF3307 domain-containing protein [Erysipelotrichaceae bacterium]|nr:DUF3307 domain-containing protein [Erysipelotrichaceae bacterium]
MQNYHDIFVVLSLVHIIADFYFQNNYIASKKEKDIKWVWIHCGIYGFVYFVLGNMIVPTLENQYWIILIISHGIIDIVKYYLVNEKILSNYQKYIFSVDQLFHLGTIIIVSYFILQSKNVYLYNDIMIKILENMDLSIQYVLSILLKVFLIHKPVNLFIVSIMKWYKPLEKDENVVKTGKMIGTLERIIMLFFLSIQQYSSVGLVLTAKSITRFNKISEDQAFAEYYLAGTLLSTICVLVVSLL